jgi:hypothetical protein
MIGVGTGVGAGVGTGVGAGVGTSVLQVEMHWPGDNEPRGSSAHRPIVVLQLYITGVGGGVGGHVGSLGKVQQSVIGICLPLHVMNVTVDFDLLHGSKPPTKTSFPWLSWK